MAALLDLKNFDIGNSQVNLWTFKKSMTGQPPQLVMTGRWVSLTQDLAKTIKDTVNFHISNFTEVLEYGLLAQNNEGSILRVPSIETHADKILTESADQIPSKKVDNLKKIQNTSFYVVKFSNPAGNLYCVKKVDSSWATKKRTGVVNAIFKENTLDLDESPTFSIAKSFDFYIINDSIFIDNKKNFESILNHKSAHKSDFTELLLEEKFAAIFTQTDIIKNYVGTNAIQLRRAAAIRQKQNYIDAQFMINLKQEFLNFGLNIKYENDGRINPTLDTCPDIFKALLDHRLKSHFSGKIFDVQNTESIAAP